MQLFPRRGPGGGRRHLRARSSRYGHPGVVDQETCENFDRQNEFGGEPAVEGREPAEQRPSSGRAMSRAPWIALLWVVAILVSRSTKAPKPRRSTVARSAGWLTPHPVPRRRQ